MLSLRSSERGLKSSGSYTVGGNTPVAPFVGAWIEIYGRIKHIHGFAVAPFVGAWIEMYVILSPCSAVSVAPFVGAWIEIAIAVDLIRELMSLRSSERGLKYKCHCQPTTLARRSVRRSVD